MKKTWGRRFTEKKLEENRVAHYDGRDEKRQRFHDYRHIDNKGLKMKQRQIGPIRFLPGPREGKYPHCHSLYIEDAGILIDPASDRKTLAALRQKEKIAMIWLTHWHEDHFMHWDLFADLPLWTGRMDAPPLTGMETFLDWYGMDLPENKHLRELWRPILKEQFHYQPRQPDRLLEDKEMIEAAGIRIQVVHTPGHTPGHLAFWFPDFQALFLGDYDLTPFGPWYGDKYSSIQATISSAGRLRNFPAETWLACHESGFFTGDTGHLWDSYLAVIDKREEKLLDVLQEPQTMEAIIRQWIVYGKAREPLDFYTFGERAIMGKHLEKLINEGRVVQEKDHYWRI